jgi:alpha-beta hydrolase superfamily lysophospholipase
VPATFHDPLQTQAPVLLLSGEYDPVTPPRYGEQVLSGLRAAEDPAATHQARHLVLTGQGHNVIGIGCMPKLMARFIDTANTSELDASCLERLSYTPAFAGFYGWEP